MTKKLIYFGALSVVLLLAPSVFAQEADDDLDVIELEIEKAAPPAKKSVVLPALDSEERKEVRYSDLGKLAAFKEVSVLQKKYQPKTGRFQFFGGLSTITNDPFFLSVAGVGKLGYYFTEKWGVEFNYSAISTSQRKSTEELKKIQNVSTASLVQSKSFLGLDLMYSPIYGKMTFLNEQIIPFDLYFTAGYGTTKTQNENAGTLHLGTGQIFAVNKGFSLRWEFSWNSFSAKGISNQSSQFNNLFLTVGASFFFPEAKYR